MFPPEVFTRAWADAERRQLGNCDPGLLEKCVHALTLLGQLAESGLPFMFKGGTSMLLHLPKIQRLSIDIDIVCPASNEELECVVGKIGQTAPFVGWGEDIRGTAAGRDPLPRRRHFQFFFHSERAHDGKANVLLDVVQEEHCPHDTVTLPIRTPFLSPDREIEVTVPTIESLLGDKLTAFAPTTTGVRLRNRDNEPGAVMQVAKQLFDVGVLFEHAADFASVVRAYDGVQAQESAYRGNFHSREASLADTLNACLGVTGARVRLAPSTIFPDTPLLLDGFRRLEGHLTQPRLNDNVRRILAARAGILASHLIEGRSVDFNAIRYAQTTAQIDVLRTASLKGHAHAWLDGIKATNPEAYHYWLKAFTLEK